ncbi:Bromodomain-containing protein, partial [Coemansia spiralis]
MTKEQHKYCTAMIRSLKKHRDAGPFLQPVDAVALNIPDYYTIIKSPMDLSTIERKLKARQYTDTQAFSDDLRLMFNNCYMYNGRDSVVGSMAGNLESMVESQLKKMPTGIDTALAEHSRRASESGARTPVSATRPKREGHPPPSRDLPGMHRKKSRTADPQMKFCLNIVKDFMKKSNFNITYPFLEPVDPVAMNCPDYFNVISEPMDLSTIKSKLESDIYSSPLEFEADMRLMFRNCYTYNPPGHPVHEAGRALEARFDSRWSE